MVNNKIQDVIVSLKGMVKIKEMTYNNVLIKRSDQSSDSYHREIMVMGMVHYQTTMNQMVRIRYT